MKILVGNQKSKIITDNPKLFTALQRLYTFQVPGAAYSPSYRRRSWDGKKRFISNAGMFRTGLLPRILDHLKKIECTPEIEYRDRKTKTPNMAHFDSMKYYDYQETLIMRALKERRGVISAPT